MIKEFELTEDQLHQLYNAAKPVPYMVFGGREPASPQDNINRLWESYGNTMGFKWDTAKPIPGKHERFFTAEVVDS